MSAFQTPGACFSTLIPTGGRVAFLECATEKELPYAATVTGDIGADYFLSARKVGLQTYQLLQPRIRATADTGLAAHTAADSGKTACLVLQKRGLHFAQCGAHGFEFFHRHIRRGDILNL